MSSFNKDIETLNKIDEDSVGISDNLFHLLTSYFLNHR
jgi:hypothetical protein